MVDSDISERTFVFQFNFTNFTFFSFYFFISFFNFCFNFCFILIFGHFYQFYFPPFLSISLQSELRLVIEDMRRGLEIMVVNMEVKYVEIMEVNMEVKINFSTLFYSLLLIFY